MVHIYIAATFKILSMSTYEHNNICSYRNTWLDIYTGRVVYNNIIMVLMTVGCMNYYNNVIMVLMTVGCLNYSNKASVEMETSNT